jgi:hypothetical protein
LSFIGSPLQFHQEYKPTRGYQLYLKKGIQGHDVVMWDVGSNMIDAPDSQIALLTSGVS